MKLPNIITKYRLLALLLASVLMLPVAMLLQRSAGAINNGDGLVLYGENNVYQPRYRTWANATNTFGSEGNAPSVGGNFQIQHMRMDTAPNKQEAVAGVTQADLTGNQLQVYHFNGTSWVWDWETTTGVNSSAPRYDVAYDETSGKALLVYARDVATTNEMAYRVWDGSTWSSETLLDPVRTSERVAFIKLLPRPGSDEIALIWGDDTNMDMSGNYYDMSSNTWSGEPASALSLNVSRIGTGTSINSNFADMAFENSSGDLQVCWGEEGVSDLYCTTRTAGTGGSWGTPSAHTSFAVEPVDMAMASEPGTDYIAYNNMRDATLNAEAGIWDGSSWGNISNYDSSLNSVGSSTTNVSVGWLVSGGQSRVVITYDDQLAAGIDWRSFNKNTSTWSAETDITASPNTNNFNDLGHIMRMNPHATNEAMFLMRDNNQDLFSRKITFDGSTITWTAVEGGAALEANMANSSTAYGWSYDFAYYNVDSTGVIDNSVAEQGTYNDGTSPAHVFVTDQIGYAFYRDRGGTCVYTKTTDGGSTWSSNSPVTISPSACFHVAVWYDRWTPGDDTGNYIHIVTADGTADDLKYNRLDVSSDTLLSGGTPTAITSSPGPAFANDFVSHDNYPSITKATDGTIYAGVHDSDATGQVSYVIKCAASCDTASNWSDTNAGMSGEAVTQAKNYGLLLEPLAGGDVMMIVSDVTNSDVLSKTYSSSSSTWAGAWTTIDANAGFNSTWAGVGISAVVNKASNDIYLAYTAQAASLGTDDDFRTAVYSGGSWTAKTDALTNDSKGLISPQLALNQSNGDVYIAYAARVTPATPESANIYWKVSTNGMTSWGSEQGPLNAAPNDLWGVRANVMSSSRIHAMWTDSISSSGSIEPRKLDGVTIATLTAPTYEQSAYRVFNNADSTNVGSAVAAANTPATLSNTQFRLRMLMHATGDGAQPGLDTFKLQFAGKGAGTCTAPSGTPSSYTDVTTSTDISFYNNPTPVDAAALTTNAGDPTHSTDTVRAQTYEEANNFTNTVKMAGGEDGLWDFSLYANGAPSTTDYCFRIVKSSGTALTTYSQYPQITTALVTNQDPDDPASLAQTKTDNTALSTGAWTNESSVKFTASASDPDSSDTLQLCVEKKLIGTAFDSNAGAESCGTGVAYSGTPVSVTVTIGSQADDEYHWQARIKDAAGAYSGWLSYGGNAESARDYGVDTSSPTGGTVYDGTSAGVDAAFNDNSLSSLSANWAGFNANISGLDHYDYSIGTTPGGTDIRNWTANGTSTSVTATGLTLHTSQAYYTNVRATDAAGNTTTVTSDGQLVLPSLSFGISSGSLSFSNLNAANSYTDTQTTTLTTSTNAYGGYVVRAFATDYLRANALTTIPDFTGGTYTSPDAWQNGDVGFGYTSSDTSVQGANIFQAATCPGGSSLASPGCYAPFSQVKPGDIVADHTANVAGTPLTNQQFTITYRVTTEASQAAANNYATTVVYSVTPIY